MDGDGAKTSGGVSARNWNFKRLQFAEKGAAATAATAAAAAAAAADTADAANGDGLKCSKVEGLVASPIFNRILWPSQDVKTLWRRPNVVGSEKQHNLVYVDIPLMEYD